MPDLLAGVQACDRACEFGLCKGDVSLLGRLFAGDWDEGFVIVPPGRRVVARNDERILDVAP